MKYIIIFNDGSRKWIGEKAAMEILKQSTTGKKQMATEAGLIRFSSIAKLLPEQEFYEQYPSEALNRLPSDIDVKKLRVPTSEYIPYLSLEKQAEKRKSSFKKLLQGLKQSIETMQAEGKTVYNAINLYETKLKLYKKLFN